MAWIVGRLAKHDNIYRAVFIWALIGIFVEQQAVPLVAGSAIAAAGVVLMMIFTTLPRQRKRQLVAM